MKKMASVKSAPFYKAYKAKPKGFNFGPQLLSVQTVNIQVYNLKLETFYS